MPGPPARHRGLEGASASMRQKNPGEQLVPLSTQVVTLFREVSAITGAGDILFPGQRRRRPANPRRRDARAGAEAPGVRS